MCPLCFHFLRPPCPEVPKSGFTYLPEALPLVSDRHCVGMDVEILLYAMYSGGFHTNTLRRGEGLSDSGEGH